MKWVKTSWAYTKHNRGAFYLYLLLFVLHNFRSALAFGYFPTYLIGAITAAQLFHYCKLDIPDIEDKIEQGNFSEIKEWLTAKVHRHGRRYKSLDALLQDQLGEDLNPEYFIDYLTDKYTELYQL